MRKRAFGYPLTTNRNNCFGVCVTEDFEYLGCWTSSDYSWLKKDLSTHATGYDYEFITEPVDKDRLIVALINKIYELRNENKKVSE